MIYLAPWALGSGTETNPFSVPLYAPGGGLIDLRRDCTRAAGHALVYVPGGSGDRRLTALGLAPGEPLAAAAQQALESRFGLTLRRRATLADAIAELLVEHAHDKTSLCRPLLPEYSRARYEVWLGELGLLWTRPALVPPHSQQHTETWPTTGSTISSGQDFAWSEVTGDLQVAAAGSCEPVATGGAADHEAMISSGTLLDSDDHLISVAATVANVAAFNQLQLLIRRASTTGTTYMRLMASRHSSPNYLRTLRKVVSGAVTNLQQDTSDPGTGTFALRSSGSSHAATFPTTTFNQTDTAVTTGKYVGFRLFAGATGGNVTSNARVNAVSFRDHQATLDAAAAVSVSAAAALTTSIDLAGGAALAVAAAAALTTEIPLVAAAAVAVSTTAALTTGILLTAAGTLTTTAAAALTTELRLAGAAALAVSGAGALTTDIRLAGAAGLVVASGGSLVTSIELSGAAPVSVSATAALVIAAQLNGMALLELSTAATLAIIVSGVTLVMTWTPRAAVSVAAVPRVDHALAAAPRASLQAAVDSRLELAATTAPGATFASTWEPQP